MWPQTTTSAATRARPRERVLLRRRARQDRHVGPSASRGRRAPRRARRHRARRSRATARHARRVSARGARCTIEPRHPARLRRRAPPPRGRRFPRETVAPAASSRSRHSRGTGADDEVAARHDHVDVAEPRIGEHRVERRQVAVHVVQRRDPHARTRYRRSARATDAPRPAVARADAAERRAAGARERRSASDGSPRRGSARSTARAPLEAPDVAARERSRTRPSSGASRNW